MSAGLYPAGVGSQQVFANQRVLADEPLARPRPAAVVVIGLGEEGRLRLNELSSSVRQGVMAYAQRESEQRGGGATGFELAATLIGSGGMGIHVGGAAQAIAQGVASANQRLRRNGWPVVSRLSLVELFLDRATEAHNALAVLAESRPTDFALAPAIQPGTGALRRPADSGYRGAAYDFITAVQRNDEHKRPMIEYTLDTQRARSEVRGQSTQVQLVDELVRVGANSDNRDTQIGRSLFQLLVPVEIEPFLSGAHSIVLQLDKHTARFPWELLDTGDAGQPEGRAREPWAVRTQVLRKLKTEEFREHPLGAGRHGGVLVIGEPACDKTRFAELPAARLEAQAVAKVLGAQALLGPDALQAVNALLAQPLRIVHIAGHGEHRDDGSGGVVLSNNTVLGAVRDRRHAQRARTGVHQLLLHRPDPPRPAGAAQCAGGRACAVCRQRGRGVDLHRRALRGGRRLGRRGRTGDALRQPLLRTPAGRRPLHRCRGRGPPRRLGGAAGGQHLGRLPVLRRPGVALCAA